RKKKAPHHTRKSCARADVGDAMLAAGERARGNVAELRTLDHETDARGEWIAFRHESQLIVPLQELAQIIVEGCASECGNLARDGVGGGAQLVVGDAHPAVERRARSTYTARIERSEARTPAMRDACASVSGRFTRSFSRASLLSAVTAS